MLVAQVAERQHLHSASRNLLVAPRFQLNTSSCLCRGCASNLEFTVRWTAKPGSPQCHLPTQLKDVSVSTIPGALSALEALCDYALYKSTFTLHYILVPAPVVNSSSPPPPSSLAPVRYRTETFWYWLTQASLENGRYSR